MHRSASSTIRSLYDGLNRRRSGLSTTSGSAELPRFAWPPRFQGHYHSLPFSLAVPTCSFSLPSPYSNSLRAPCLTYVGREGKWKRARLIPVVGIKGDRELNSGPRLHSLLCSPSCDLRHELLTPRQLFGGKATVDTYTEVRTRTASRCGSPTSVIRRDLTCAYHL